MNQGGDVVVAISESLVDDNLAKMLMQHDIPYMRGPLDDVLKRYVMASADLQDNDFIVRLTADNVFPDGKFINELINYAITNQVEYLSTQYDQNGFPYGLGAEVFRVYALRQADIYATADYDREHVTPWIKSNFIHTHYLFKENLKISHLRCTLDTLQDYLTLQVIFEEIEDPVNIKWQQLCKILSMKDSKLFISKCTLGTAQLGLAYGVTNKKGLMSEEQAFSLIECALQNGIYSFDTARGYGCAEGRLGKILPKDKNITVVTKLTPFPEDEVNNHLYPNYVRESIQQSCNQLQKETLDILMLHRFWHYQNPIIWNEILSLREKQVIKHLGISVNSIAEAQCALNEQNFDYIQLPYNIVDWRWNAPDFQSCIKANPHKTIFVRSVFLQGLMVSPLELWPEKFKEIGKSLLPLLNEWVKILKRKNIQDLCLAYANAQSWISSIIIGCQDEMELVENKELFNEPKLLPSECEALQLALPQLPESFLNPSLW